MQYVPSLPDCRHTKRKPSTRRQTALIMFNYLLMVSQIPFRVVAAEIELAKTNGAVTS